MKTIQKMDRMSFNQLSRNEQICLYLHDHPYALSQKLMLYVATHYMNIGYIRKRIKELYPKIVKNNIQDNNFVLIPEHYVQNKE